MHLWLNGELASIILFGSFLIFCLWSMASANIRGAKKQKKQQPKKMDVLVLILGSAVFVGMAFAHKWIAGVALF